MVFVESYINYCSFIKKTEGKTMKLIKKSSLVALSGALLLAVFASGSAKAESNPFSAQDLITVSVAGGNGKCGEGKMDKADMDKMATKKKAKCGEGKCGEGKMKAMKAKAKADAKMKCGEGKMKAKADAKMKCGEGKMKAHADEKMKDMKTKGKCGESHVKKSKGKCGEGK
jgi:uncharacterized low-complexity protein